MYGSKGEQKEKHVYVDRKVKKQKVKTKERESNHVTNCKGCVETSSTDFLLTK